MRPRIGFLVPPPYWKARVVGVYAKAVSLLHADGALVSLVRGAKDMEARAIALEGDWDSFALQAGQAFGRSGEGRQAYVEYRESADGSGGIGPILTLGGGCPGATPGHSLALSGAELWDPRDSLRRACLQARGQAGYPNAALAASLALLESALAPSAAGEGADDGIGGVGPFGEAFARLKERRDFPACLVGFGPGTTPAGDDWLAGYLAAADMRALAADLAAGPGGTAAESGGPPSDSRTPRIDTAPLRAAIAAGLPRTGAAGRALLLGALAGAPPAYLLRVGLACLRGDGDGGSALRKAIVEALGHGASSGRDSLAGFQAGLGGIQDFPPRE